jgi:DNA-binding transcriptional MocR family regulator
MSTIAFARGIPSPDILPTTELADCARHVIETDGGTVLNYGHSFGYPPLREWLAEQHGVPMERVALTVGALGGFNVLARELFAAPGPSNEAVVEAPTYDRTILALRSVGAELSAVAVTEDGLDLDGLERLLATEPAPRLLYVIPTFQNPSGRTHSEDERRAVVELAQARGVTVFEDDPYRLVRYEGDNVPSLFEISEGNGVIFACSFSKSVAPGLRAGYLIVPEDVVAPLTSALATMYISPPMLPQAAIYELIRRGKFESALENTRTELKARRDAMLEALERSMPEGTSWSRPEGGYFLWVDLPQGVKVEPLLEQAREAGVTFVKGTDFFTEGSGDESLRLAFSYPSVSEIHDGIDRLGALVGKAAGG